jgi:mannitol/fructose-specific phosphotransferase system IIA component (Ntr-type)
MSKKPSNRINKLSATQGIQAVDFKMMLSPDRVIELTADTKEGVLEELIDLTGASDQVADQDRFRKAIYDREKLLSTGVGNGIGLPHVKIPAVRDFVMSVGRQPDGIADYQSQDGKPVHLVLMIGANDTQSNAFLKVLARLMMKLKNQSTRDSLMEAESTRQIYELLTADH